MQDKKSTYKVVFMGLLIITLLMIFLPSRRQSKNSNTPIPIERVKSNYKPFVIDTQKPPTEEEVFRILLEMGSLHYELNQK